MKRVLIVMDEVVARLLRRGAPRAPEASEVPIGVALGGEAFVWKLGEMDGVTIVGGGFGSSGAGAVPLGKNEGGDGNAEEGRE